MSSSSPPTPTLPTPCARDGKGPGHRYGLPRLVETGHPTTSHPPPGGATATGAAEAVEDARLLPTPTAASYGYNRSPSPGAATRPSLHTLATRHPLTDRDDNAGADGPPPLLLRTRATGDRTRRKTRGPAGPAVLPTPRASDGVKGSPGQRDSRGNPTLPAAAVAVATLPTPTASEQRGPGRRGTGGNNLRTTITNLPTAEPDHARWGRYAHAIARWQRLSGRPVPAPTQPGRHGQPVLAPSFVEWLMGLPEGRVCRHGLARTVALRLLGNGVVPQQATAALRALLILHARAGTP